MASVLMVAAENGHLPGGKVGGIADVVQELSQALAEAGHQVTIVTPGYGNYANSQAGSIATVNARFGNAELAAKLVVAAERDGVRSLVFEHPQLLGGAVGQIYVHDAAGEPFATDATRFALFSSLVANWLDAAGGVDVLHLHDWHAAPVAILRAFSAQHRALRSIKTVYTIHNLALQGIRPLRNHESSLANWFGALAYDERIIDPRWPDCVNLMRAGITLSDRVNTVSPTYSEEIQCGNDEVRGRHGGEGLEADLQRIAGAGLLAGILNGCSYGEAPDAALTPPELLQVLRREVLRLVGAEVTMRSAHAVALDNIDRNMSSPPAIVVTSVGRAVHQKLGLLAVDVDGMTVLDRLLAEAGEEFLFVFVGSGEPDMERFMVQRAVEHSNLVFVAGYSAAAANMLYASGQLFLMPSLFEPCGLSQMLAMRAGQPCLVHGVGGLQDTVRHGETGWVFDGNSMQEQAANLIDLFREVLVEVRDDSATYTSVSQAASATRFTWDAAAAQYLTLYGLAP